MHRSTTINTPTVATVSPCFLDTTHSSSNKMVMIPEWIPSDSIGSWCFDDTATNRSVVLCNSPPDDDNYDDNDDWLVHLTSNEQQQQQTFPKRVSLDSSCCTTHSPWLDDANYVMDIDDLSYLDDDDETADEQQVHWQWLEHGNRLSACMKKSQETRNQILQQFLAKQQQQANELSHAFTQTQESMMAIQDKVLLVGEMIVEERDHHHHDGETF